MTPAERELLTATAEALVQLMEMVGTFVAFRVPAAEEGSEILQQIARAAASIRGVVAIVQDEAARSAVEGWR